MVQAYQAPKAHLGLNIGRETFLSEVMQVVEIEEEVRKALNIDIVRLAEKEPVDASTYDRETDIITDEWGVEWRRPPGGLYYDADNAPLADAAIEDLDTYPWSDADNAERTEGLEDKAREIYENSEYALYGDLPGDNIFEYALYLRGMETFLMDMVTNKPFVHALMRKITDVQKKRAANFLAKTGKYVNIVRTSDDLGTQTSLLVSPDMYRELIKPYQREFFAVIKENSNAKILHHCCGNIHPLIEDFIEVGVDILNPVQVACESMDTKVLKETFGDRICFCGAIDTQYVLPYGTPEEIREETKTGLPIWRLAAVIFWGPCTISRPTSHRKALGQCTGPPKNSGTIRSGFKDMSEAAPK
jgi:uroporphyrinogen decarboxylase